MTVSRLRALVIAASGHPVTFLLAVNIACAALGLAQFAYSLAILKPTDFAVIGVLAAIGGVVTGLLDVKLLDLTTKLYFAVPKEQRDRRSRILAASLSLHFAVGLLIGGLVIAAGVAFSERFLHRSLVVWWLMAIALRMAVAYPVNALTAYLRLIGHFASAGWLRLAMQVAVTAITVTALAINPGLAGYFGAVAVSAVASLIMALAWSAYSVQSALGAPLVQARLACELRSYLATGTFMVGGSLASLAKLLSRSCDTLLVAALVDEATTGLYRVARQAFDNLAGLSDAVHQFYTPTIVDGASRARWSEVARHQTRLMLLGVAAATATLALSWLVLRPLAAARYPYYLPALTAFEILSGQFVVMLGVHGWLWPILVARGGVAIFGLLGVLGATAQLATIVILGRSGLLDVASAAAVAWIAVMITYAPLLRRASQTIKAG